MEVVKETSLDVKQLGRISKMHYEQRADIKEHQEEMKKDLKTLLKKPKIKREKQTLRDAIPQNVMTFILRDTKPLRMRNTTWRCFNL